jgi:bifunctional DNA-binding transcriptional regulator/antitoxin component of YhaV-PrlF toxin-antitoxin module
MGEQTIRYMNERGSVTIDSEIREVLDLKDKKALVRLCEIQVVKVEDDEIDVEDLPDETCRTISRINNRGIVRIDEEVREVLGINGRKAMLKIGDIEVAKIVDEPLSGVRSSIIPIDIGAFYARTVAEWSQRKDVLLRAHRNIEYPLRRSTAAKIIGTGILIAMVAAVLLSQNGALEALATGDRIEWTSMTIALAFGVIMIVQSLPDRKETVRSLIENSPE